MTLSYLFDIYEALCVSMAEGLDTCFIGQRPRKAESFRPSWARTSVGPAAVDISAVRVVSRTISSSRGTAPQCFFIIELRREVDGWLVTNNASKMDIRYNTL